MRCFSVFITALMCLMLFFQDIYAWPASPLRANADNDTTFNDDSPIKGRLYIDYGVNFYTDHPDKLEPKYFPPKGVNLGYQYNIQLGRHFSINPGFGLGLENYMFRKNAVLAPDDDTLNVAIDDSSGNYKKSKLSLNYFDIPLEITFRSSNGDKAFKCAVGAKFGILFSSHSKRKYERSSDGATVKVQHNDNFHVKQFRYGVSGRIGYANFILFGYYGLNGIFQDDKGPDMNPITIGISVIPFD